MDLAALASFFDRHRTRILAGLAGAYALWAAAFIWKSSFLALDGQRYFCLFDDAMISMRYADNLAHGEGLVWNPGERVEGYSNFLMVLLMSAAATLFDRRGAALAVQVLGAVMMLALAFTVMGAARRLLALEGGGSETGNAGRAAWKERLLPMLAFVAALGYYPLQYWSLMGMETGLLALLLALSVRLALGCGPAPSTGGPESAPASPGAATAWRLQAIALCMGMAFLTRIDAAIFGLPLALYLAFRLRGEGSWRDVARRLRGPALVFAALAGGHFAFRLAYYGHWLPNTYALKLTGVPLDARLADGWSFVQPFLREARWAFAAALLGLVLRPRPERLFLALVGTLGLLYQIWNGGDPWNYWRMMSPGMPWLFLLGLLGLASLAGLKPLARFAPAGLALVALGTALVLWKSSHRFREEALLRVPAQYAEAHRNLVNRSLALAALTDSTATLGLFWAGTPPYFADRAAVDFLGKNDPVIARHPPDLSGRIAWNGMRSVPGHNKYDLDYSIKVLLPTYVEAFRWGGQDLEPWAKDHYVTAFYRGERMHLLKDSPAVRWERTDSVITWEGADRLPSW